jgi:hypothetical protein
VGGAFSSGGTPLSLAEKLLLKNFSRFPHFLENEEKSSPNVYKLFAGRS